MPPSPVYSAECRQDMSAPPRFHLPATVDPTDPRQVADVAIGYADAVGTWGRNERDRVNGCASETRDNAARYSDWLARQAGEEAAQSATGGARGAPLRADGGEHSN